MKHILNFLNKYIAVIIFLILWELIPRFGWVNPIFVPPLSRVLVTAWQLTTTGELIMHTRLSLVRAIEGYSASVLIGLPLGLLLGGWFRYLKTALEPLMDIFSQTNPLILFHIIMFFFGIGELTKVIIITWLCVWPITFSTIAGIQNVDPVILKAARSFGLGRLALFRKVIIPAASPSIFTGMRLSAGYSFFMIIAAEMMGASSGLGWLVVTSQESYQINRIFAGAMVITVLGLISDSMMKYIQKRFIVGEVDKEIQI